MLSMLNPNMNDKKRFCVTRRSQFVGLFVFVYQTSSLLNFLIEIVFLLISCLCEENDIRFRAFFEDTMVFSYITSCVTMEVFNSDVI